MKAKVALPLIFTLLGITSHQAMAASAGTQIVKGGYAHVGYHSQSGELSGDLTPGGVLAEAADHGVAALTYEYFITDNWSLQLAGGYPPTVALVAKGTGSALGEVGETKTLFPALIGLYNYDVNKTVTVYGGAGINYTHYVDSKTYASYDNAFGGKSSVDIDDSFGGVVKVGFSIHLDETWLVDFAYSKYWISADATIKTATSGVGDVSRTIDLDVDPSVFSVMLGYKF